MEVEAVKSVGAPSLRARFAVAIALTLAFYALAIGVAAALIGLPIWGWVSLHHGNLWITIFMVAAGLTILRSIIPQRQHFVAPGPRVDASQQPRLMEEVSAVARATDQEPPADTYVTLEANAAVAEVPAGRFGRRRRVLLLGLPLLHILTATELRSVLAHEFGHYAGGDTRLGTWIFRIRAAIGRTITGLHDDESFWMKVIQKPFIWYGNAFLRITNAISRRQEFAADAWAARIAGKGTHVSTLRKIHRLAPAYDAYWSQEVVPVLETGKRPPVGTGFAQFVVTPEVAEACDASLASELEEVKSDPYSSHPTLPERLAATEALDAGDGDAGGDDAPALSLLARPEEVERAALTQIAKAAGAPSLEPIAWEEVGRGVYLRRFERTVTEHARVVDGQTVAALPEATADPGAIARRAFGEGVREDTHPVVLATLSAALGLALVRQGWTIDAQLARPIECSRGDARIDPFEVVHGMAAGELSAEGWADLRASLDIEDAPLDAATGAAEAESAAVA